MHLRVALAVMNMSRGELAERLGVTPPLISMWENGKIPIPENRQQQLNEIFGVPITIEKESNEMKHSQAFQNGRRQALQWIENKIEERLNRENGTGEQISNQRFTAQAKTSRERLGFASADEGHKAEQQAFENTLSAVKKIQNHRAPRQVGNPQGSPTALDCFPGFIPGPERVKQMLANSKQQRAEFHQVAVDNQAAARRRLGLSRPKKDLADKLAALLDED